MGIYWNTKYYEQPDLHKIQAQSKETIKKELKKGKKLEPIVIEGRKIAKNWWGIAWCENLEKYADYESRIERGKRYVRNGSVVDLKVQKGKILAKVQGRRKTPYKVEIRISPLPEEKCQAIIAQCENKIQHFEALMLGDIPIDMQEIFKGEQGLFPTPREISFSCSCPDWALMCKHVAAVLYGVGARFDEQPLLFFELRGIDANKFIDLTLTSKVDSMLANEAKPSSRIILDVDALSLFDLN